MSGGAKREHHYSFLAQMNEVEALPQMMLRQVANDVGYRPMMLRLRRKRCCASRKRNCNRLFGSLIYR